jgi:hypothetical protein
MRSIFDYDNIDIITTFSFYQLNRFSVRSGFSTDHFRDRDFNNIPVIVADQTVSALLRFAEREGVSDRIFAYAHTGYDPGSTSHLYSARAMRSIDDVQLIVRARSEQTSNFDERINSIHEIRGTKKISDEAKDKAEQLLLSYLDEDQLKLYKNNNFFVVYGSETGTPYRINKATQINVDVLNENLDKTGERLCAIPDENVPVCDHMLSQKLMIENNENKFLDVAHKWGSRESGTTWDFPEATVRAYRR